MSGIAEVLLNLGYGVSGTDLKERDTTRRLVELGAHDQVRPRRRARRRRRRGGHLERRQADNPEVVAARARGIPVIPRAEMLAELMRMKYGVAVAGSHGKTTTTSLVATVLHARRARSDRGHRRQAAARSGSNARLGRASTWWPRPTSRDGSFLKLTPTVAVVTNIDPEHLDHYGTLDALKQHLRRLHQQGAVLRPRACCASTTRARAVDPAARREAPRDLRLRAAGATTAPSTSRFDGLAHELHRRSCAARRSAASSCAMPGRHNVLNALAALAVADYLGVDFAVYQRGARRLQRRRPPLHRARRGARRHGRRRLRPPPRRDPRHARGRAHRLPRAPPRRRLPAAPLHAHARPHGRVRARLQRRRRWSP